MTQPPQMPPIGPGQPYPYPGAPQDYQPWAPPGNYPPPPGGFPPQEPVNYPPGEPLDYPPGNYPPQEPVDYPPAPVPQPYPQYPYPPDPQHQQYNYPYPPPYPPAPRRRSKWLIVLAIVIPLVIAAVAAGGWAFYRWSGADQRAVKTATTRFAEAIDTEDTQKMLAALCQEEVDQIKHDGELDLVDDDPLPADNIEPIDITKVAIRGEAAKADFSRPKSGHTGSLYLRKESGTWKVCAPAEAQFEGS